MEALRKVVLLTNPDDGPALTACLVAAVPNLAIEWVQTLDSLYQLCAAADYNVRLIAYQTPVIVPAALLERMPFPAYNFHPGPPTYPGSAPDAFAIYEGATRYGATAHVMVKAVDAGPIVAVNWFEVPPGSGRMGLARAAQKVARDLFMLLAPQIVTAERPLAALPVRWSGQKRASRDFASLCQLPSDIDALELERRYRAFGEGPCNPLRMHLHGFSFMMENRGRVHGHLDGIFQGAIQGWAKLQSDDRRRLLIKITIDQLHEFYGIAQEFRLDVRDAGYGDGNSGFSVPIPESLCDGLHHWIHVSAPDHADEPLIGSPAEFLFPSLGNRFVVGSGAPT